MYSNKFSKYLLKKKPIVKKLVDTLGQDFEYVSCLATDVKGTRLVANKQITNISPSALTESGFVIKVKGKDLYFEYSTNEISDKNFDFLLEEIKREAKKKQTIKCVDAKVLEEEPLVKNFVRKNKGRDYTNKELLEMLKSKVEKYAKDDIVNAHVLIEKNEYSKMFISKKKELTQYYVYNGVMCVAISYLNGSIKEGYAGKGYASLEEAIDNLDSSVEYAINVARTLQKAEAPTPGIYDVITAPSVTGLIVHEAFGHGVEMDMFVKDRAKAKEYVGKEVASKLVSMHDGAKACLSAASYFFDDDGVLAQDTLIIDKGILKRGISDALSAMELNTVPTGNSRRESYKRKAYTRMTNTFFEGGNSTLDEMIKSMDYGYLICDFNNGMEDPKNWGIQCTACYGKEIKNGEFTGKVIAPVVMSGYVIDLLKSITMISKDIEILGTGSCGKGYKEYVRVSDGGGYMKARVKIG